MSLGAHFPADVLAGFQSSLAAVLLVYVAVHKMMKLIAGRTIHRRGM